jgi:tetratricopeptide (TPR) repeat protein
MTSGSSARLHLAALALGAALAAACDAPPSQAQEHLRRGDAALSAGRYPAALAAYSHAHELAPTDGAVQRAMMRARVHLVAESAARLNADGIEDARYEAEVLLDTDKPRAPVYLTALANVLVRQGDVEAAKIKLAEALKLDPTSTLAHTALGVILMAYKENVAQAKAELELALKTRPEHAPALLALGQLKLAEGDLASAVDRLEAALRGGDNFAARMALGSARVQQQKPAEALPHFERAAQLDPRSPDALVELGQARLSVGRPEDAERAIRAAMQLRVDPTTQVALAFALARQKKLEPALALFRTVLAQDDTAAGALHGAGIVSEELGQSEQALAYYQRVLAVPATGRERQMLVEIQRDAQARVTRLSEAAMSASAPQAPRTR